MGEKKYYWLKLKRDFFKRHDIKIIEAMPNGKDYILFYLKLLCESVDHEGTLRFSDEIPYSEEMLATITDTNVDIVKGAIKVFTGLKMMDILDDGTLFMNEVEKMIGVATQDEHTRESTRRRVQAFRERKKLEQIECSRYSNVTCNGEIEIDIEIDKDKEIEKEIEINNNIESSTNRPRVVDIENEFETVWDMYPRKQGKDRALKSYVKARKEGILKETIEQGILDYCAYIQAYNIEGKFIKMGSTWFNQRCWTDDHSMRVADRNDWLKEMQL